MEFCNECDRLSAICVFCKHFDFIEGYCSEHNTEKSPDDVCEQYCCRCLEGFDHPEKGAPFDEWGYDQMKKKAWTCPHCGGSQVNLRTCPKCERVSGDGRKAPTTGALNMPMSPKEKYQNDPEYHALVDMMVKFIDGCKYTPSEMREAAVLASIICEQNRIGPI